MQTGEVCESVQGGILQEEPWNDRWTIDITKAAKERLHQMINTESF